MRDTDYMAQYRMMKRYYRKLFEIYPGIEHAKDTDYLQDDVNAFFMSCWHLKDWVDNDPNLGICGKANASNFTKYDP